MAMDDLGMNMISSQVVPEGRVFLMPPWIGECRIIAGVAVRYRRTETRNGKDHQVFSPLTDDEKRQMAVINNIDIPPDIVLT